MPGSEVARFDDAVARHGLEERRSLSVVTIPVDRVVGSVDRWQDFDSEFRLKNGGKSERLSTIMRLMRDGAPLPPIEAYKVGTKYYVVDGNHRVAAAKQLGQEFIDAHVVEFLPPDDTPEHSIWRERSRFEFLTGLFDIDLGDLGMHPLLLKYIRIYKDELEKKEGREVDLKTAASRWYSEIYQPVVRAIDREDLLWRFPNHTAGELFLYATHHKYVKSHLQGEDISYEESIRDLRLDDPGESLYNRIASVFRGLFITPVCTNCGSCERACPEGLICERDGRLRIDPGCGGCGSCEKVCPVPYAIGRFA